VAVFRKVIKKSKGGADFGQIAVLLTLLLQRGEPIVRIGIWQRDNKRLPN